MVIYWWRMINLRLNYSLISAGLQEGVIRKTWVLGSNFKEALVLIFSFSYLCCSGCTEDPSLRTPILRH